MQKKLGNDPNSKFEENDSEDEKDQLQQKFHESYCIGTNRYKLKQQGQFEDLGEDFASTQLNTEMGIPKPDIEYKLAEELLDQQNRIKNDPNGGSLSLKEKRGDGFLNRKIRNLTIATYLRCLYAAIEYSPSYTLKCDAINNIREPMMFRDITKLCDTTHWDPECNIGAKYLRVMRSAIKLPLEKDHETLDMLVHYELIAIVIQKCLAQLVDKMKKGIELNDGD